MKITPRPPVVLAAQEGRPVQPASPPGFGPVQRRAPVAALAALLGCCFGLALLAAPRPAPPSPVGIWVVSPKQLEAVNGPSASTPGSGWPFRRLPRTGPYVQSPSPFRFDGATVYRDDIRKRHGWEEGPEDNVWRLRGRWHGNDLYCLWPGTEAWSKMGTFVDGHFLTESGGITWVMEKADPRHPDPSLAPLARPGKPWHYPDLAANHRPPAVCLEWGPDPAGRGRPLEPVRVLREQPGGYLEITPHPNRLWVVAYSPDGRHLVAAGSRWELTAKKDLGYARIWDVASGRAEGTLEDLPADVWSVAFRPDSAQFALGCGDGTVSVRDLASRREVFTWPRPPRTGR
jgi:hypothetical protein